MMKCKSKYIAISALRDIYNAHCEQYGFQRTDISGLSRRLNRTDVKGRSEDADRGFVAAWQIEQMFLDAVDNPNYQYRGDNLNFFKAIGRDLGLDIDFDKLYKPSQKEVVGTMDEMEAAAKVLDDAMLKVRNMMSGMQSKLQYQKEAMSKHIHAQEDIIEALRAAMKNLEQENSAMIGLPEEDAGKVHLALQLLNSVEDKAALSALFALPEAQEDEMAAIA